jgi:hypothetical protein
MLKRLSRSRIKENLVSSASLEHFNQVSEDLASAVKILTSLPVELARRKGPVLT